MDDDFERRRADGLKQTVAFLMERNPWLTEQRARRLLSEIAASSLMRLPIVQSLPEDVRKPYVRLSAIRDSYCEIQVDDDYVIVDDLN